MHFLKERVERQRSPGDKRLEYLNIMEESIPQSIAKNLELTARLNPEYMKSKYVQKPLITKEIIVEFNYYLRNGLWEYEMCDHLYDKTLINTYYFRQILRCIQEERRFIEDRFTRFKSKKLLFRIFKGSGRRILLQNMFGSKDCTGLGRWSNSQF